MSINSLGNDVSSGDVETAKVSLRVDPDDTFDDGLIKMLIKAARRDIIEQVGEQIDDYFDDNEIFSAAVLIEVGHLYNHRDSTSTQQEYEVPMALYSLINALKDDYRYRIALLNKDSDQDADKVADDNAADSDQSSNGSGSNG